MADTYILDWTLTNTPKQPTDSEVTLWLEAQGYELQSRPRVYNNGMVKVEVLGAEGLEDKWRDFAPITMTVEDKLGAYIKALIEARAELMTMPESQRSALDRLTLANTALLLYGYGITDD